MTWRSVELRTTARALAIAALIGGGAACAPDEPPPPPPPSVKVAPVLQRDVPVYVEAIGETRGNTETEIRARVEGFVERVHFVEGTRVRRGELLYTLDSRPFIESLAEARAQLAEAEAQLSRTRQDVARFEPLVPRKAVSRQEYETSVALAEAAAASVDAAGAATRRAEVDLGYTRVTAPDDGLIGKTEVQAGTLVGRGMPTLLTRISKVDPIHVRFTVPEADYLRYSRAARASEEGESKNLRFDLVLADGSVHPHPGQFTFIDRAVDPVTGTIMMEAAFPNPGDVVRPGQYAKVRASISTRSGAILVPQRAVQEIQGLFSVAVVKADDTVELRPVKPAERIGGLWVIESGLAAGDRIVVEGLQKVRPGMTVAVEAVTIEDSGAGGAASSGV